MRESSDQKTSTWRIFISSTAVDLVAHRDAVADAILRLGNLPVRMETFGARPNTPVAECERLVRESDAVLVIVAHRYGWVPSVEHGGRDGKSITWIELEAALDSGRPVFAFVVEDAYRWTEAKEQDRLQRPDVLADPAKVAEVVAAVGALQRFKSWLKGVGGVIVDTFSTPDNLAKKAATSLATWALAHVAAGKSHEARGNSIQAEIRICQALQPAPHFRGRVALVEDLCAWWTDPAHFERVRALVAAGGTGKTAIVEQVLRRARSREQRGHTLVWSFYENPEADTFLREACDLFLGEREGAAGGRLERLERGLREGNRPHLLVLDGLERLQAEARQGHARGEIEDHTTRLLLRAIAAGLGRARALVTSRFPLSDLKAWTGAGYGEVRLNDLDSPAAVAVLRSWKVRGDDSRLATLAGDVGNHALSVSVLGSFLASFGDGDPEFANRLRLREQAGDDPQAAKLTRILRGYGEHLPPKERDLLVRLSVFPRGVSVALLAIVVGAGGKVAGSLRKCDDVELLQLARRLVERGLAFSYNRGAELTFTAHPFLRDWFRQLLGSHTTSVHEAIRKAIAPTLITKPGRMPADPVLLDRYETFIDHTLRAGREREAYDLYRHTLGGYDNLVRNLGENTRGARILSDFSTSGRPEDMAPTLPLPTRSMLLTDWALCGKNLGQIAFASQLLTLEETWTRKVGRSDDLSISLQNAADLALLQGRLQLASRHAGEALVHAEESEEVGGRIESLSYRATASHALGYVDAARADFETAQYLSERRKLFSLPGVRQARHWLDLGKVRMARYETQANLAKCHFNYWHRDIARCHALLGRAALLGALHETTYYLDYVRRWTAKSGDMEMVIEGHWIASDLARRRGDLTGSLDEAITGLHHAEVSDFGILVIELLILLSRIHLAWPDARTALKQAQCAIDLATAPRCNYVWGEADAAHLCGEAHLGLGESEQARLRFEQALAVRERIEHPGAAKTRAALARLATN